MELTYKVLDVSDIRARGNPALRLEEILNDADERGYELVQVLESRELQIVLRRKPKGSIKE